MGPEERGIVRWFALSKKEIQKPETRNLIPIRFVRATRFCVSKKSPSHYVHSHGHAPFVLLLGDSIHSIVPDRVFTASGRRYP